MRQWVAKAEADLAAARHLLAASGDLFHIAGFHCQQAAEKFLKALLVEHQIEFSKTHDLAEILDLVERLDPALANSLREAEALTPYGV